MLSPILISEHGNTSCSSHISESISESSTPVVVQDNYQQTPLTPNILGLPFTSFEAVQADPRNGNTSNLSDDDYLFPGANTIEANFGESDPEIELPDILGDASMGETSVHNTDNNRSQVFEGAETNSSNNPHHSNADSNSAMSEYDHFDEFCKATTETIQEATEQAIELLHISDECQGSDLESLEDRVARFQPNYQFWIDDWQAQASIFVSRLEDENSLADHPETIEVSYAKVARQWEIEFGYEAFPYAVWLSMLQPPSSSAVETEIDDDRAKVEQVLATYSIYLEKMFDAYSRLPYGSYWAICFRQRKAHLPTLLRTYGFRHILTAKTLSELGYFIYHYNNSNSRYIEILQMSLEGYRRLGMVNHTFTRAPIIILVLAYKNYGRCEEALALFKEAYEVQRRQHGNNNIKTTRLLCEYLKAGIEVNLIETNSKQVRDALAASQYVIPRHDSCDINIIEAQCSMGELLIDVGDVELGKEILEGISNLDVTTYSSSAKVRTLALGNHAAFTVGLSNYEAHDFKAAILSFNRSLQHGLLTYGANDGDVRKTIYWITISMSARGLVMYVEPLLSRLERFYEYKDVFGKRRFQEIWIEYQAATFRLYIKSDEWEVARLIAPF